MTQVQETIGSSTQCASPRTAAMHNTAWGSAHANSLHARFKIDAFHFFFAWIMGAQTHAGSELMTKDGQELDAAPASSKRSPTVSERTERITGSELAHVVDRPPGASAILGEHGAVPSVGLHLLPGVLTGALFFALQPLVVAAGYPPRLALVLAMPLALLPVTLGVLMYLGHRRNGRLSLQGVVLYRERVPLRRYVVWVPTAFVASLGVFSIGGIVIDEPLRAALFRWMPSLDWGLGGGYSRATLIVTFAVAALFVLLLESTLEEVYFRGFLLPRMAYAGRWAVVLHSGLFALYHLWMPWRLVSLALGILPLVVAVRRTRNIYIGMIVHVLLNSWDIIVGIAFILAMTPG